MTTKKISLTGIKPTGTPHLGNYIGAIKPALTLADKYEARYFIADYHAINSLKDPGKLRDYTYEVAATWLACGLDPEKVLFYRQSDIPEVFELSTLLMCYTAKGRLNGAHAYKAVVAENQENGKDPDKGVNAGLFTYPVLMAADILLFDANVVPIGKDQIQHLEIANDIAEAMHHNYKQELFTLPEPLYNDDTMIIVGVDGRKMSKSYDNTIPLFVDSKKLRKIIMKIVTTSQTMEEPKDPETCHIFSLYRHFSSHEEQDILSKKYKAGGMGWGEAKETLYQAVEKTVSSARKVYSDLLDDKKKIDHYLNEGAEKAREIAAKKMSFLRNAIGL